MRVERLRKNRLKRIGRFSDVKNFVGTRRKLRFYTSINFIMVKAAVFHSVCVQSTVPPWLRIH